MIKIGASYGSGIRSRIPGLFDSVSIESFWAQYNKEKKFQSKSFSQRHLCICHLFLEWTGLMHLMSFTFFYFFWMTMKMSGFYLLDPHRACSYCCF
jgi:hypothetical protein